MGDDFAFDAGGRKPGCDGSDADRRRERERPMAAHNRRCYGRSEQERCCPWRGLPLDGEVDDSPAAECDREPRHQPAWSDLGRRPFAHALRRTACEIPEALRPGQCGPAARRHPRPPRLGPSARSTLLDHRAAPWHPRYISPGYPTQCRWPGHGLARVSTALAVDGTECNVKAAPTFLPGPSVIAKGNSGG